MSWEDDILRKFRNERSMTQAQFAEWLEIPKRTYEKWESGERVPPQWVISLIKFKCEKSTKGEQTKIEFEEDTLYRTYVKYEGDKRWLHSRDYQGTETENLQKWIKNFFDHNISEGIIRKYQLIEEQKLK